MTSEQKTKRAATMRSRRHLYGLYVRHQRPIGTKRINNGYVLIKINQAGWELEHRLIMEKFLNRKLHKNEYVHHINHNRIDNRIENLELMSASQHSHHHGMERAEKTIKKYTGCRECGSAERKHTARGLCKLCYYRLRRKNMLPESLSTPR